MENLKKIYYEICFNVLCLDLQPFQNIYITGNISELGKWENKNALELKWWKGKKYLSEKIILTSNHQFEFDYLIYNTLDKSFLHQKKIKMINFESLPSNHIYQINGNFNIPQKFSLSFADEWTQVDVYINSPYI